MPIKRFEECEYHDPTSPQCLVAKSQLETLEKNKKAIEFANISNLINIICTLVITIAVVFAAVAICKWTVEHKTIVQVVERPNYGTVRMVER